MQQTSARDVVEYGVSLLPYVLAVQALAVVPFLIGFGSLQNGDQLGLVVVLAGAILSSAGALAILQKVIADGVAAGWLTVRNPDTDRRTAESTDDATAVPDPSVESGG